MKFFTPLLILVSSLLCSETLIHAGKYIDVVNGKVISKSSIVILKVLYNGTYITIIKLYATVVLMASTKAFQAFGTGSNPVSRSNLV